MTPATTKKPAGKALLSFRNRIFIGFFTVLLLLQGITALFSWNALDTGVQLQMTDALETSRRLFQSELKSRNQYLQSYAGTLARDTALQRAIGFRDFKTLKSTLNNHITRVGADIAFVSDYDGAVVSSTVAIPVETHRNIIAPLDPRDNQIYEKVINIDGHFYQLVIVPITQSGVNVWLSIGFAFDKALATHFNDITGLGINFVSMNGQTMNVVASTLSDIRSRLKLMEASESALQSGEPHFLTAEQNIMQVGHLIARNGDETLLVVIQKTRQGLFGSLTEWWAKLLGLFTISLFAVSIVAAIIARSVTKPVEALLSLVKKVASGEYHTTIETWRQDEIGELANEFQAMNLAVAERERQIRFQAERDGLTGLQTREVFVRSLTQAIENDTNPNPQYCVGLLNINRFKDINDTLGHNNGDQLLVRVTERLKQIFSPNTLARQGADQFLFFLPLSQYGELRDIGQRTTTVFAEPFAQSGINITLSSTLGVAIYPEHSRDCATLIRLAEIAVSSAKDKRMEFAIYDKKNDNHSVQRLSLMSDLPSAITKGELELYYQPTLSLQEDGSHKVTKTECLVRWHHPSYGFIPPDDFIALAEQSGSITLLTQWVLKTALEQCQKWRQAGYEIGVAVNISAIDLFRGNLQTSVPELLKHYDIPSEMLTLEVTESEIMEDPEHAYNILRDIKALGVRLSVDDYGTGYSSLAHLKQLPVHELKIDKSFVMDMSRDKDDATIVKSTIELGHTMGLTVVAEGVEDKHTLGLLSKLGCNYAQGYYISKPMPITELEKWLSETDYVVTLSPQPDSDAS